MTDNQIIQLWKTAADLYPMPISRTRARICTWIHDVQELGLINAEEAELLRQDDMEWRTRMMEWNS